MKDKLWLTTATSACVALVAGLSARADAGALGVALATFLALGVVYLVSAAVEFTPEEGVPVNAPEQSLDHFRPGFGRALIEQLPTALVLIDRGGKIAYANQPARILVPRLAPGGHFANLFRAPGFVEAVSLTLSDGDEREVAFTLQGSMQHFEARIARLPSELDPERSGQVVVQIEDRTKARLSDEMRRDFIANASHELRTLLSLSRIELKEHVRPQEPCEFYALVRDTMDALRPTSEKIGVELVDALPSQDIELPGDRDELLQVLHNLIDNAIKYSGKGTTVTLQAPEPNPAYPGMVGVRVEDSGPGIGREHLVRLTERFYRVSVLQSRNKGGTGLGLAIVKHIINRHAGELQIESELGKGSRFTVWLPLKTVNETVDAEIIQEISAA